jgi:hypothetical protein
MPSKRTYAKILYYSRTFSALSGFAALCVVGAFALNLWLYTSDILASPLVIVAFLFSFIAAVLVIFSMWMTARFLDRFGKAGSRITYADFKRRTFLFWVLFILVTILSVYSLFLFFQYDLFDNLYPLLVAATVGMFVLQFIFIMLWTIVIPNMD